MLSSFEAIIFDLDGTLVDSMWVWEKVDIDFLKSRGLDMPPDLQKTVEGMSFKETAQYFKKRFNLPEPIEDIMNQWRLMTIDYYKYSIPLKKGVLDFIFNLKSLKKKLGIGTSNSKELAIEVLKKHDILKFFDTIRTSCEVQNGKPSPDIFIQVAKDLNVEPAKCLVFEDTYAGVLAAKRAGMKVYAVSDDSSLKYKSEIIKIADKYIKTFEEIA